MDMVPVARAGGLEWGQGRKRLREFGGDLERVRRGAFQRLSREGLVESIARFSTQGFLLYLTAYPRRLTWAECFRYGTVQYGTKRVVARGQSKSQSFGMHCV